jgi:hypothetical protein
MSEFIIGRLNALKRGEQLVYYRGNFEEDIVRSEADGVAAYGLILLQVRGTASYLAKAGKLRLEKHPYSKADGLFEYLAIGVR